jgi:hypothetical protein
VHLCCCVTSYFFLTHRQDHRLAHLQFPHLPTTVPGLGLKCFYKCKYGFPNRACSQVLPKGFAISEAALSSPGAKVGGCAEKCGVIWCAAACTLLDGHTFEQGVSSVYMWNTQPISSGRIQPACDTRGWLYGVITPYNHGIIARVDPIFEQRPLRAV